MLGTDKTTERGFSLVEFADHYGHQCSLQQSSCASLDCVWLGINDGEPKIMKSDAVKLGLEVTGEVSGWMPYEIPKEVLIHTRMHLNREQVAGLITRLQKWLDSGNF